MQSQKTSYQNIFGQEGVVFCIEYPYLALLWLLLGWGFLTHIPSTTLHTSTTPHIVQKEGKGWGVGWDGMVTTTPTKVVFVDKIVVERRGKNGPLHYVCFAYFFTCCCCSRVLVLVLVVFVAFDAIALVVFRDLAKILSQCHNLVP